MTKPNYEYPLKYIFPSGAIVICHNQADVDRCRQQEQAQLTRGLLISIPIAIAIAAVIIYFIKV